MLNKGLMTSNSEEWATPLKFYEELNNIYNFTLDPCSSKENHKCIKYYTKEDDGLSKTWRGERVYLNPPYGRSISKWVEKAFNENKKYNNLIVLLLPARTDTKWFHDYIYNKHEVIFIKGRLKFNDGKNSAPFPSMLVIMKESTNGKQKNI